MGYRCDNWGMLQKKKKNSKKQGTTKNKCKSDNPKEKYWAPKANE